MNRWVDAKEEVKKSTTFQNQLDSLLDLRPVSCSSLSSYKEHLKKSVNADWENDYLFFKDQLAHQQTTSMSSTTDAVLQRQNKAKASKEAKALLFMDKNKGDFGKTSTEPEKELQAGPSHSGVIEENILDKSPRQCSKDSDKPGHSQLSRRLVK